MVLGGVWEWTERRVLLLVGRGCLKLKLKRRRQQHWSRRRSRPDRSSLAGDHDLCVMLEQGCCFSMLLPLLVIGEAICKA